jgi:hypothetical protein
MTQRLDAVQIRHDFVHRNGRTPEGTEITLTPDQIKELVRLVENLVEGVEAQQQELSEKAKSTEQVGENIADPQAPS